MGDEETPTPTPGPGADQDEAVSDSKALLDAAMEAHKLAQETHDLAARTNKIKKQNLEDAKAATRAKEEELDAAREELKILRAKGDSSKKAKEDTLKTIRKLVEETENLRTASEDWKNEIDAADELVDDISEGLFNAVGLTGKWGKGFKNLSKSGITFKGISADVAANMTKAAGPAAISGLIMIGTEIFKAALELDAFSAGLAKTTGMTESMSVELTTMSVDAMRLGVTLEQSGAAVNALYSEMTSFKNSSEASKRTMIETTAMLEHMGISSQETAGNIQFMTASLGMSGTQASETVAEFANLATEIGMPIQQMSSQFQANAPILAKFGRQGPEVFKKLAVAARAAGMDVSSVLAITEKFDTFEGAAQSVGQLNAILGGPFLNSMDMVMETDPTERMRMLSQSLNDAGQSFDQMDYYTRKSIASAAGLKDVNELALVMKGRFDLVGGTMNQSADDIAKLAERQHEFNSTMEQLKLVTQQAIVPIANAFLPMLKTLGGWLQTIAPALPYIMGALIAIGVGLTAWWIVPFGGAAAAVAGLVSGLVTLGGMIFHSVASPSLLAAFSTYLPNAINKLIEPFKWLQSAIAGVGSKLKDLGKLVFHRWASPSLDKALGEILPASTGKTAKGFVELEADTAAYTKSVGDLGKAKNKAKLDTPSANFTEPSHTTASMLEILRDKKASAKATPASNASTKPNTITKQPLKLSLEIGGNPLKEYIVDIVDKAVDGESTTIVARRTA